MPIKPENRNRYPADWPQIRERILVRAGNCCEQCKVPNGAHIMRGEGRDAGTFMNFDAEVFDAETGKLLGQWRMSEYESKPWIKIVLTIAHLDHTPENCAEDNLRALCQLHHLVYDAKHHAETAAATRRTRKAIGELF